jgi:ABC-type dipeptide/oligopeptide/nickel transport system permease subunit
MRQPPYPPVAAEDQQHIMGIDGNVRDEFSRIYIASGELIDRFHHGHLAILIGTFRALWQASWRRTDNITMRLWMCLAFPSLLL